MVLVLGIGNSLLQDDGIGCHLVERLTLEKPHWPIELMDGGTLSFSLVSSIESSSHLIVLDAANLGQSPGSVKTIRNKELDEFLNKPGKSVHEVSLSELFDMTRLTDSLPCQRAMVAVQPKNITWGEALTPEVAAAVPLAMLQIESLLLEWGILAAGSSSHKQGISQ